ncbi:MAG: sodium-dependent transporter [Clostridia bacterium]|nr:sodium-dependent transporter [Clostridia bacterium]
MNKRENFKSRLGFILVSAGCAIGIGNVWRFPYVVGQNGGGFFVLLYLLFLLVMGVPVLTMELAVGRASRKGAVLSYKTLEKPGHKWHIHGWFCMLGCYLLMMYYTTVSGWMLAFFFKFAGGAFSKMTEPAQVSAVFGSLLADPLEMGIWMAITVLLGLLVCSRGLQKGIEKVSKVMMSALLVLILVLAVNSLMLSGAGEGLKFYLEPNLNAIRSNGVWQTVTAAMNQAFFTLSLGIAAMEIFGSFMPGDKTLTGESLRICALDTFVAIMSGLIIFPACFTYGIQPDAGPSLIFVTLPNVFVNMPGGRIWGSLFFLFMSFASFSTIIAVFENIMSFTEEMFHISRKKAVLYNGLFILIASIPCVLGYNVWQNLHLIGGRDVLDSEDFIVSNLLLPIGALVYLLFCVSRWGWGFDNYLKECNSGEGMKLPRALKPFLQFVLPVLIVILIIQGLV